MPIMVNCLRSAIQLLKFILYTPKIISKLDGSKLFFVILMQIWIDVQSILPIDSIWILSLRIRCLTSEILVRQTNLQWN